MLKIAEYPSKRARRAKAESEAALDLALELADSYLADKEAAPLIAPPKRRLVEISRITGKPKQIRRRSENRIGRFAFLRVRAMLLDLVDEYKREHDGDFHGALAFAGRSLGFANDIAHVIYHQKIETIGMRIVERVAKKRGMTIASLTDPAVFMRGRR